jgi:hypothetical protein
MNIPANGALIILKKVGSVPGVTKLKTLKRDTKTSTVAVFGKPPKTITPGTMSIAFATAQDTPSPTKFFGSAQAAAVGT